MIQYVSSLITRENNKTFKNFIILFFAACSFLIIFMHGSGYSSYPCVFSWDIIFNVVSKPSENKIIGTLYRPSLAS